MKPYNVSMNAEIYGRDGFPSRVVLMEPLGKNPTILDAVLKKSRAYVPESDYDELYVSHQKALLLLREIYGRCEDKHEYRDRLRELGIEVD